MTIPLKYRFSDDANDIGEEFTSGINLNFLLGFSYGNTAFTFRDKVGNKTNTWKLTGGIILGASTVELNSVNTSASTSPIVSGNTINQGLFSFGFGATYSFNKLNFGVFYGWDYSLGDASEKWNYNKLPWLGFHLIFAKIFFAGNLPENALRILKILAGTIVFFVIMPHLKNSLKKSMSNMILSFLIHLSILRIIKVRTPKEIWQDLMKPCLSTTSFLRYQNY